MKHKYLNLNRLKPNLHLLLYLNQAYLIACFINCNLERTTAISVSIKFTLSVIKEITAVTWSNAQCVLLNDKGGIDCVYSVCTP